MQSKIIKITGLIILFNFILLPVGLYAKGKVHEHLAYVPSADDMLRAIAIQLEIEKSGNSPNYNFRDAIRRIFQSRNKKLTSHMFLNKIENITFIGGKNAPLRYLRIARDELDRFIQESNKKVQELEDELSNNTLTKRQRGRIKNKINQVKPKSKAKNLLRDLRTATGGTPTQEEIARLFKTPLVKESYGNVVKNLSFGGELRLLLGRSPKPEDLKILFECGTSGNIEIQKKQYMFAGSMRNNIFKSLRKTRRDLVYKPFELYLKNTELAHKVHFSFSMALKEKDSVFKSQDIRKLYEMFGKKVDFQISLPRGFLTQKEWAKSCRFYMSIIRENRGIPISIDISGSINEGSFNPSYDRRMKVKIRKRIKDLLEIAYHGGGDFRIHAFEGARKADFYKVMWDVLEKDVATGRIRKLPKKIRIGHIAAIEEKDILRFNKIQKKMKMKGIKTEFVFEANFMSNKSIQGLEMKEFLNKVSFIKKHGFTVTLGTDGVGVHKTTILDQIEYFYKNGAKKSFKRLDAVAHLVENSKINRMGWKLYIRKRAHQNKKLPFAMCLEFGLQHVKAKACSVKSLFSDSLKYCQ